MVECYVTLPSHYAKDHHGIRMEQIIPQAYVPSEMFQGHPDVLEEITNVPVQKRMVSLESSGWAVLMVKRVWDSVITTISGSGLRGAVMITWKHSTILKREAMLPCVGVV